MFLRSLPLRSECLLWCRKAASCTAYCCALRESVLCAEGQRRAASLRVALCIALCGYLPPVCCARSAEALLTRACCLGSTWRLHCCTTTAARSTSACIACQRRSTCAATAAVLCVRTHCTLPQYCRGKEHSVGQCRTVESILWTELTAAFSGPVDLWTSDCLTCEKEKRLKSTLRAYN